MQKRSLAQGAGFSSPSPSFWVSAVGWAGNASPKAGAPPAPVIAYALLLAGFHRFLVYALLEGRLLDPTGALLSAVFFVLLFLLSWRTRIAAKMIRQYPWLYERKGPLGWRNRSSA